MLYLYSIAGLLEHLPLLATERSWGEDVQLVPPFPVPQATSLECPERYCISGSFHQKNPYML